MAVRPVVELDGVFKKAKERGAERLYHDWAASYDADLAALGYRVPHLGAAFLARYASLGGGPILDAGAGTGQVGRDLEVLGYKNIVGIDICEDMLKIAGASGAYSSLRRQTLGERLDFHDNTFAGIVCVGCFGPGHAPPSTLAEFARVAKPGAPIVFSVVESSWRKQGFPEAIQDLNGDGAWQLVEERDNWRTYTIGEPDYFSRMFVFKAA